jgi:cyclase
VRELSEVCFMPLSVGGGVRSVEDVRALLQAGADKVVIRSAGVALMEKAAPIVGCQALVAALDVNGIGHKPPGFDYVVGRAPLGRCWGRRDHAHPHGARGDAVRLRPRPDPRRGGRG